MAPTTTLAMSPIRALVFMTMLASQPMMPPTTRVDDESHVAPPDPRTA